MSFQWAVYGSINNFNHMTTSLPRIRTQSTLLPQEALGKRLMNAEYPQTDRKPTLMSSRQTTSLERISTIHEQREHRNNKIHLNLIQRKLRAGTYDEGQETSKQLTQLKQKTDEFRLDALKTKNDVDKMSLRLSEIRKNIASISSKQGQVSSKVQVVHEKCEKQKQSKVSTQEDRMVLEYVLDRDKTINLTLKAKNLATKAQVERLSSSKVIFDREARQIIEKSNSIEVELQALKQKISHQKFARDNHILEHQNAIARRVKGEIQLAEKSRQYKRDLEENDNKAISEKFSRVYEQVLHQLFIQRYFKAFQASLKMKYSNTEHLWTLITSYKSFNAQESMAMGERYFSIDAITDEMEKQIIKKESFVSSLEKQNKELQATLAALEVEGGVAASERASKKPKLSENQAQHMLGLRHQTESTRTKLQALRKWVDQYARAFRVRGQSTSKLFVNLLQTLKIETDEFQTSQANQSELL